MAEQTQPTALDALMHWLEGSGGESGETLAAPQEEVEEIWMAAWGARGTEVAAYRDALAFAASVIKSGEPWTATCEAKIGGALAKL